MICRIDNCGLTVRNKKQQLCNRHYLKFRRHGDPLFKPVLQRDLTCVVKNCNSSCYVRNHCAKHYDKLIVYGDPTTVKVRHELHGLYKHPLYMTYRRMIQRCHHPADGNYKRYGARGIRVCDEWRNSFSSFLKYVGDKPSPKHSIDRIDNDGNYEPGNVRWATASVQLLNTGIRKDNTSGSKGVSWDKSRSLWRAYVGGGTSRVELGYYETKQEAVDAVANERLKNPIK